MTPTAVGWVLADGEDADGVALAQAAIPLHRHRGSGAVGAVNTSEQAAAAVLRLRSAVEAQGQRLRGVGVTWSGDVAAEAALLLESLTDAGFDNVVPVRFGRAAESLAEGVGRDCGSGQPAVCIIEPDLATVLMTDGSNDDAPAVVQQAISDDDDVVGWLASLFPSAGQRPRALILSGSKAALGVLAVRLESKLGLPVVVEADAQLTLAHGAALALDPGSELSDAFTGVEPSDAPISGPDTGRELSYSGAWAMLVVGVLTFVVSLSMALSLQLTPTNDLPPAERMAQSPGTSTIAPVAAP